jgi:hypothetical protein
VDASIPFLINDADNHFVEPLDVYERYIEPRWRDKAVRWVKDADGGWIQLFAGRPSRTRLSRDSAPENEEELEKQRGSRRPRALTPAPSWRRARRYACTGSPLQGQEPRRQRALLVKFGGSARRGGRERASS